MLEIRNNTAFSPMLIPALDKHGKNYAVVIVKGSFKINPRQSSLVIEDEQTPAQQSDEFFGEPGESSLRYEADNALVKPSVDIVLNGHAYAPGGKALTQLDTSLQFGKHRQVVKVIGDRIWQKQNRSWHMSAPKPFERLPLHYEHAYGGAVFDEDGKATGDYCSQNPFGKGFVGEKGQGLKEGLPLPNLENPAQLIQSWQDRPQPTGFGFIARNWEPRLGYAGSYDNKWQKQRMPLLPLDFDDYYYQAAHANLTLPGIIPANELFTMTNLCESGSLAFNLPTCALTVSALIRGKTSDFQPKLDTIVIEPDDLRVLLTWRIAIPCARQFLYIKSITVNGGIC